MARFLDKQLELILGTHCDSGSEVDICPGFHAPEHVYSCKGHTRQTTGEHYGMPVTQLNNTDPPTYVFADFLYSVKNRPPLPLLVALPTQSAPLSPLLVSALLLSWFADPHTCCVSEHPTQKVLLFLN